MHSAFRFVAVACGVGAFASSAWGAGFEIPGNSAAGVGRGMAWTASVDDGTAVAHNPGLLSQQKGTRIQWSHQILWSHESFTRAPSQAPQNPVKGTDPAYALQPSANKTPMFPLGAFMSASTDFGMSDFTFAIAGYGPSANGHKEFDMQGGQRYMLTKLDALLAYASVAAAYGKKDRFGVGVTLQWAMMPKTDMTLAVDAATGGPQNPYYSGNDVIATIHLADMTAFSAIVGGWMALNDHFDLAASGRVMPVSFHAEGSLSLTNDKDGAGAAFSASQLSVTDPRTALDMKLAPTAAIAARWHTGEAGKAGAMDAEVDAVWEGWSVLDDYKVKNYGKINLFGAQQMPDVSIAKRWRDTLSVRMGGTHWLQDGLGVSAGGYFEQGAAPLNYSHLDFPSFNRFGVGTGVRYKAGKWTANLAYAHVFQETRTVTETYGKLAQTRPLAPCPDQCQGFDSLPVNAGKFETSYDMLTWSLGVAF